MPFDCLQDRPRILFVTSHWPLAPAYGAQQRVLNIGRMLTRYGDLSFVIVPTEHEDEETVRRTRGEFDVRRIIRPVPVAPDRSFSRLLQRFRHEFDPGFMATDPLVSSERDRAALIELMQEFDVVWVHTIRTSQWFRIYRWPHSILDVDDLPSRRYQSSVQAGGRPLRRLLDLRMHWIWRRRERILPKRFDVLATCSEDDRQYLSEVGRTYVIPNGSHPLPERPRASSGMPRIGLIGNCTFPPNEEGVIWFIREVWPKIKREFPLLQLRLVGRGSEGHLTRTGPDVVGLGWLEDPADEISTWSAMIVPIKVGGGTRVKVAEGFARRCPIVATRIGIFGYAAEPGRDFLLADSADDFASACIALVRNPELGRAISENAHRRFLEQWTWESSAPIIGTAVQKCLELNKAANSATNSPPPALISNGL